MARLDIRFLDSVVNVNTWEEASGLSLSAGDPETVYFQIVDATRRDRGCVEETAAVRYVPEADATLTVLFDNVDDAKKVTKTATQPFVGDLSIWRVTLTATETAKLAGTVAAVWTLTEDTRVRSGRMNAALLIQGD